jgi:uncharacterized membrane protein
MAGNLLNELPELVKANIISPETADKIREYYQAKSKGSENRLFVAFGILGALLIGLGLILIIAHNWDELSRSVKTVFGFLPLIIGQLACGFVLLKKPDNQTWKETASAFLFLAVGATISLVSQIYNIPGNLSQFLLTWMLLCLPLIYIMRSGMASLLYIGGITWFAAEAGYWSYPYRENYYYWPLLFLGLPFYYFYQLKKPESNFTIFHHWFIPLSLSVALGTVAYGTDELLFVAYCSLFGFFYILGNTAIMQAGKQRTNGYRTIGLLGTIGLLLFLSFRQVWTGIAKPEILRLQTLASPEFLAALVISVLAGFLFFRKQKPLGFKNLELLEITFLIFIVIFKLSFVSTIVAVILVNLLVLFIGIVTIYKGTKLNHLGILNSGLLIISALVVCRFFDTDLTFVVRGLLFIGVGAAFFMANYRMLKKRKTHEA